jgi:hypothetical protein
VVEWRFVEGKSERYREIAAELVRLKVDAIVTASGDEPIIATMNVTKQSQLFLRLAPIQLLAGSSRVSRIPGAMSRA